MILYNGSLTVDQTFNDTRAYTLVASVTTDPFPYGDEDPTIFSFVMAQLQIRRENGSFVTSDLRNPSWDLTACDVKMSGWLYEGLNVVCSSPLKLKLFSDNITGQRYLQQLPTPSCRFSSPGDQPLLDNKQLQGVHSYGSNFIARRCELDLLCGS